MPDTDDGGDDTNLEAVAFERAALLNMSLEISDMPSGFGLRERPAGETGVAQGLPHGAAAAVAGGVDIRFGDGLNIRPAAEE